MARPIVSPWRSLRRLSVALVLSMACGCTAIRVVSESPNGGTIALPSNSNCWPMYYRDRAARLMSAKCPEGYRIDREEFVWNGKPGVEGHRYTQSYFGYTDPNDEFGPYLRKEYRITFHTAPPGKSAPTTQDVPPQTGQSDTTTPLRDKEGEELPPPRPIKK